MIKAAGNTGDGKPLLLVGLSGENITRLVAGEPINITAANMVEMGMPELTLAIVYGKTEEVILGELRRQGATDAHTQVHDGR